ncbi:DoxX family protein [Sphingobacterium lactis]|uniref:Putative oxidoreductase n=1 Tax=Sphingobacterium lactis TaxID=797291 RepID=A0A1H5SB67_9SPHI|nr:DoxX family protein [Sphingobacterium lactis]SEF47822.1 putative oxidoreductase [Sphingobacterium lactis]
MKNSKIDLGLLIIRVGFGLTMMLFHGLPKLMGGPEGWTAIGKSMEVMGINFLPTAFGFTAGLVETVGSLLLILGLWTRPAAILLAMTMLVAATKHLIQGDGWSVASHAIEFLAVYVAFAVMGPGKLSVDKK